MHGEKDVLRVGLTEVEAVANRHTLLAMKLFPIGILALLAVLLASSGCARQPKTCGCSNQIDVGPDLLAREVAPGAFEITHGVPWSANSLLVEMADRTLVLVATPYTPEATVRVLAWARGHFGARPMVAINNGFHVDNLGGNAALREAGIPVYGSDRTVALLAERGERTRQHILSMIGDSTSVAYAEQKKVPYLPPDHVFPADQGLVLNFGGDEVRVIYPGPSQAPDKLAVYFPSRKLLYGGCMILSGGKVGNVADADLDAWPKAVEALLPLPVKIVVPGHGERLDPRLLQHTLDVLARTPRPGG
jgi:metallo-beta-lactamase class B